MPADAAVDGASYFQQALTRINEIGTTALAAHNRHHSNLDLIGQLNILTASHGASELNQKYGVLYTEPNAESAKAEQAMDVGSTAQMAAGAAQNAISAANANSTLASADLRNILAYSLGDLKASMNPVLTAINGSLASLQASLAALEARLAAGAGIAK